MSEDRGVGVFLLGAGWKEVDCAECGKAPGDATPMCKACHPMTRSKATLDEVLAALRRNGRR